MLRVDSHAWVVSSAGAYWKATEKAEEKVKIVNHNRWLSLFIQQFVFISVLSVGAVIFSGCPSDDDETSRTDEKGNAATRNEAREYYCLTVDTAGEMFDANDYVEAAAGSVGGQIAVFVNGNPIGLYHKGGVLQDIGHLIRPGSNSFAARGRNDNPVYFKLGVMDNEGTYRCIMRVKKEPSDDVNATATTEFTADIDYELPIFSAGSILPNNRGLVESDLSQLIADIYSRISRHDGESVANIMFDEGPKTWLRLGGGVSERELAKHREEICRFYSSRDLHLEPYDPNDLKFIFGKNLVMVYRQVEDEWGLDKWGLFVMRKPDSPDEFTPSSWITSPTLFAAIDGKWVVWSGL